MLQKYLIYLVSVKYTRCPSREAAKIHHVINLCFYCLYASLFYCAARNACVLRLSCGSLHAVCKLLRHGGCTATTMAREFQKRLWSWVSYYTGLVSERGCMHCVPRSNFSAYVVADVAITKIGELWPDEVRVIFLRGCLWPGILDITTLCILRSMVRYNATSNLNLRCFKLFKLRKYLFSLMHRCVNPS